MVTVLQESDAATSDATLVDRFRSGDRAAFAHALRSVAPALPQIPLASRISISPLLTNR